jgi:hypothetical protein
VDENQSCLDALTQSIEQLGGVVDSVQLENTAELIIQAMTGTWRNFHTPEHIFEVGSGGDAIEVLAALFHDMVYVQVDQASSLNISSYLTPFIKEVRNSELVIRSDQEIAPDRMFEIVCTIFGMKKGQVLSPFAGQNEFLSGLIAAKCLKPLLPENTIAEIIACIEATVPFRSPSPTGQTCSQMLFDRLGVANDKFDFGWNSEQMTVMVKRAVRLSNRDVENFAAPQSADFLDNTWNLLPETNHELSNGSSYSVVGYRKSLQKMEGFMNFLKPEAVFHQFQGEPEDPDYKEMVINTRKNLEVSKLYLGSKLFTIALLEALSYRLGKTIPVSTMMGEHPSSGMKVAALADFLPDIPLTKKLETPMEVEVFEILNKGRNKESRYDIKNSPLATLIVKLLGFSGIMESLKQAKEFFNGNFTPEEFLEKCDPEIVEIVTGALLQLFESRKAALRGLSKTSTY